MPCVSVVMPTYNAASFVRETIDSVLAQNFRDFEFLIVDDASKDETVNVVGSYSDPRIRLLQQPVNSGTAAAVNLGYEAAQGEYIAHIDHDDIALKDRLQAQLGFLRKNPKIMILGGGMQAFGAAEATISMPPDDATIKANLLSGTSNINNPTVMMRSALIKEAGLRLDPALSWACDWNFWVEAMLRRVKFANLPRVVLRYRVHQGQQSKNMSDMRPQFAIVRRKIMAKFFPVLTVSEVGVLEPLLQWIQPPGIQLQQLEAGLALIPKAMACKASDCGEGNLQVKGYLQACQRRWQEAIARMKGPAPTA